MKTIEEDILCMLGALNAISRRGGGAGAKNPPPPPTHEPNDGEMPPPPPPRGQGAGRMLGFLLDMGEMSQSQLADNLGIRPQSLSELLAKTEADGMVTRRRSEEDKRQTLVSLTDLGRTRVEAFREAHKKRAADFLAPLSTEEKYALADILRKLIEANEKND